MDAIDQFVDLFESKEEFVKAFVESTLFFPPDVVQERNNELVDIYNGNHADEEKFYVRYGEKVNQMWQVKNKKQAIKHSKKMTSF